MEERMYTNPITQRNIRVLQEVGFKFVGPENGRLASGRTGVGRMAEVELIIQAIIEELNISDQKCSNAKNKTEDKEKKRLRRPAITRLYESGGERHGSLRSS
jgi:phosphopantothenoylcysteine synthetase/decarboxylase